jgi:hypothetical protein
MDINNDEILQEVIELIQEECGYGFDIDENGEEIINEYPALDLSHGYSWETILNFTK